jgi:hypothetical protein
MVVRSPQFNSRHNFTSRAANARTLVQYLKLQKLRRGGRVAEGGGLLNRYRG